MTRARHVSRHCRTNHRDLFFLLGIALYALSFLIARERMFPLRSRTRFAHALGASTRTHCSAPIALILGSVQFQPQLSVLPPRASPDAGQIYVVAVIGTGTASLYTSFFSYGGAVTHAAFGLLALVLTATMYKSGAGMWPCIMSGCCAASR